MPDLDHNTPLYPLRFRPRLASRMWGGRRLQPVLHKALPPGEVIGESWEIYDFPPGVVESTRDWLSASIADGALAGHTLHELMQAIPRRVLGPVEPLSTPAGAQFPLLVKFLDAQQDLSVQVHPTGAYAAAHPGAHVKDEAWYVLAAEPGSRLLIGLNSGVTRAQFEAALAEGGVERLLNRIPARVGDVHYLPSGTLHALGAGILVAEVQTPSDTTFRVFDFERIDPATGRRRELHVEQAMEVIDFDAAAPGFQTESAAANDDPANREDLDGLLVASPQFTLSRWSAQEGMCRPLAAGAPSILIITGGEGHIAGQDFQKLRFRKGDTLLIPADLTGQQLDPETYCQWLEVTFPK